jgi:putative DNA methylase
MISTDPPYYDNISYADLSDFFYIWLRRALKGSYPSLFQTMLAPKAEELVATPYRFEGGKAEARTFFENGMLAAFKNIHAQARDDVPTTIYYAFKQSAVGWETMLAALIKAGFMISATWPMRTELVTALKGKLNALSSSIVLACRKRPANAPSCSRREFVSNLRRQLKPAVAMLKTAGIPPVDLAQSAIGPGMGVYSRYSEVLESDGNPLGAGAALEIINQELEGFLAEQDDWLGAETGFCVALYSENAFEFIKFGEADVLARAKNVSIESLAAKGALLAQKGSVRLLRRDEIAKNKPGGKMPVWLLTQRLAHAMETVGISGAAEIASGIEADEFDGAKTLAYRLFAIAEKNGWSQEALAYNSLVADWESARAAARETALPSTLAAKRDRLENEYGL